MPRTPIYITTAPWWQLVAAQVVALLCFLAAIIATFAGPGPYSESEVSTYDCDAGQHVWDPTRCRGYQIGTDEHREWTTDVTGTGKSSRYWGVSLRPYRKVASPPPEKDAYVKMHLTVNTTLYYYDNKKSEWVNDGPSRAHKLDFKCHSLKFQGKCEPISLAYEVSVKHKENRLVTFFESSSVLGDAVFITEKGNPSWTTLELSFTFIFLIVSIAAFVAMLVLLFRYKSRTWHFEQTASLVLIVLLVLYNNPFFAIVYLTRNLFTVILGSLFKTLFVSGLLLFWLMFSDKIHHRGAISLRSRNNILKMAVTAIFFVITIIGCIVAK